MVTKICAQFVLICATITKIFARSISDLFAMFLRETREVLPSPKPCDLTVLQDIRDPLETSHKSIQLKDG